MRKLVIEGVKEGYIIRDAKDGSYVHAYKKLTTAVKKAENLVK